MVYEITGEDIGLIKGARGVDAVLQNVRMILAVVKGSCPLERELGLDRKIVDRPLAVQKALLAQEVFIQVRRFEPRAEVQEIDWEYDEMQGWTYPKIWIEVNLNGSF